MQTTFNGQKIQERMDELGLSFRDVAAEFYVRFRYPISHQSVFQWVEGKTHPNYNNLTMLAKILKVHEGYFFTS